MFAIYGTSGRLFHGPFEELRQVAPIWHNLKVRAVQAEGQRVDADGSRTGTTPIASPATRAQQALQVYAQESSPVRQPLSRVADVMSRRAVTVPEQASLREAFELLRLEGFSQAPVVDTDDRLVGLLSWDRLLHSGQLTAPSADSAAWFDLMRQNVREWMWTPVPSVDPQTDIRRLAMVLLETGLAGLPVVLADGKVSGFAARSDILRAVTHDPPLDLWAR